jgi:restriction endonuclease-like protein
MDISSNAAETRVNNNLHGRCHTAFRSSLMKVRPLAILDGVKWATLLTDNLVPGIELEDFQADFAAGAGRELTGKMRAPFSSSALVVNTFARWRHNPDTLHLAGITGFRSLEFEVKCFSGLRGTPPHLDLVAKMEDTVVAVESKCLEYLAPKQPQFRTAYDSIVDSRSSSSWFKLIEELRRAHPYRWLDVAQLIKHYLGLCHSFPDQKVKLLYLYWEPRNWKDFPVFSEHRAEIAKFSERVDGDDYVTFESQSYSSLWDSWVKLVEPDWIPDHMRALRDRYSVTI